MQYEPHHCAQDPQRSMNMLTLNPTALKTAKTLESFGCSECNRVKLKEYKNGGKNIQDLKKVFPRIENYIN